MKKIFLTIFLCSISYSQSPISAVSVATDTLFSFLNTHIFIHDTVFLHVPLDTAYTNAKLSSVYLDTTKGASGVAGGDTIQLPFSDFPRLSKANHFLNKQWFDSMSIGQSTIPVGYMVGLNGNLSDTQTVNNPSYPTINLSQTGQVVLDGSGFTGTDYTMPIQYIAVKFTPTSSSSFGDFIISAKRSGTITNTNDFLAFYIIDDNGGIPDAIPSAGMLITGLGNIFYSQLTTAYQNFIIGMNTGDQLSSGTPYWLLIYYSSAPSGGNVIFNSNTKTNYGATAPDGGTWTNTNVQLNYQFRAQTNSPISVYSSNIGNGLSYLTTGAIHSNVDNGTAIYGNSGNGGAGVYGNAQNDYGVFGVSQNNVGVQAESFTNIAFYALSHATIANTSTGSYAGEFQNTYGSTFLVDKQGVLGQADATDEFAIKRRAITNSSGSKNMTGNVFVINDKKTGTGTWSGSIIQGQLDDTARFDFNPRVADGANVYAYMFDTKIALANATARLMQWRNRGTSKASLYQDGTFSIAGNDSIGGTLTENSTSTFKSTISIKPVATSPVKDLLNLQPSSSSTPILDVDTTEVLIGGASSNGYTLHAKARMQVDSATLHIGAVTIQPLITAPVKDLFTVISGNGVKALDVDTAEAIFIDSVRVQGNFKVNGLIKYSSASVDSFSTTSATKTESVTGSSIGDVVLVTPLCPAYSATPDTGQQYSAYVFPAGTVNIKRSTLRPGGTAKSGAQFQWAILSKQ